MLKGELQRKVRAMESVPLVHMDAVVEYILSLPLVNVVEGLHDPEMFVSLVKTATEHAERRNGDSPVDPLVGLSALSLTSPGTRGEPAGMITPPPAQSAQSRAVTPASERERLAAAVGRLGLDNGAQVATVELLATLPKKERALCIFNQDYLRSKVAEAQDVLHAEDNTPSSNQSAPAAPGRPTPPPVESGEKAASEPAVFRVITHSTMPSNQETLYKSGDPPARSANTPQHTLTSLAALPAKEIIRLAGSPALDYLPLPKADSLVLKSTDEFIDNLQGKPTHEQKQLLGEKLYVSGISSPISLPHITCFRFKIIRVRILLLRQRSVSLISFLLCLGIRHQRSGMLFLNPSFLQI